MAQNGRPATPPYVSFRTFLNTLTWMAEDGVPSRIDRSFWEQRLSGTNGAQLVHALRFLDLVDDNHRPQPTLEDMVKNPNRREAILRERLLRNYAGAVQGLDLQRASLGELEERFRIYAIDGETMRKALSFFIHAAAYSGTPLSSHITKKSRTVDRAHGTKKKTALPRRRPTEEEPVRPKLVSNPITTGEYDLHPSIHGLLADLPRKSPDWTMLDQDMWIRTFVSTVKYAYPAREVQMELDL